MNRDQGAGIATPEYAPSEQTEEWDDIRMSSWVPESRAMTWMWADPSSDRDWRAVPAHIDEWLDWYAEAENTDEWTYLRTTKPAGFGQEGEQVALHQKWWILLLPQQGAAYLVKPAYLRPVRPRSRAISPRSSRREGPGPLRRLEPRPGQEQEPTLGPPALGGDGSPGDHNPWGEVG